MKKSFITSGQVQQQRKAQVSKIAFIESSEKSFFSIHVENLKGFASADLYFL